MLQIKDSHKLFEFKTYFNNSTKAVSHIIDIFQVFSSNRITKGVFNEKSKGFSLTYLLETLILLPFLGAKNIRSLFSQHYQLFYKGQKDSLYDTLRREDTDWRKLLINFAKQFLSKLATGTPEKRILFFIADDSDLEKSTPFFEGISRVFNHVTKSHPFAYKILTLGFSDGTSFIPLDFSLHNEKGKKNNFGLTVKERRGQSSKHRTPSSKGAKRLQELRMQKGTSLIKMIKRAAKHGIIADYLLTDSWFLCENLIKEIRGIKDGAMHILSMCKMDNRKYLLDQGEYNAAALCKNYRHTAKRSKKHRALYIELNVEYKGIEMRLFFVRLSKRSKWRLLATTDLSLKFTEAYELYSNRWAIEVFFKECKQLLGLGRNQSRDFDAQIASATICFIQYTVLALYKRFNTYETIGGLFSASKVSITQQMFGERIKMVLLELIETLVDVLNLAVDLDDIVQKLITKTELDSKIELIFSPSNYLGERYASV